MRKWRRTAGLVVTILLLLVAFALGAAVAWAQADAPAPVEGPEAAGCDAPPGEGLRAEARAGVRRTAARQAGRGQGLGPCAA